VVFLSNNALVRTEQRLSVGVQGYLPPHNFTVMQHDSSSFFLAWTTSVTNDRLSEYPIPNLVNSPHSHNAIIASGGNGIANCRIADDPDLRRMFG